MERLTKRTLHNIAYMAIADRLTKQEQEIEGSKPVLEGIYALMQKLADYEDTGLTPEEIYELQEKHEALEDGAKNAYSLYREYKDAEEQGLMVRLPCKVGSTIYDIYEFIENKNHPEVYEYEAETIEIGKDKHGRYFVIDCTIFRQEDFGKTVFLTLTEAEAKLEGGAPADQ